MGQELHHSTPYLTPDNPESYMVSGLSCRHPSSLDTLHSPLDTRPSTLLTLEQQLQS